MATSSLARQLGSLFWDGSAAGVSDRQLLERFAAVRDEAAFAALVARHGPMVLGVCRQLLNDHHDAEDAFQAVFLVLARRAGSLREPELLGNWLYGVAVRTARRARVRLERRRQVDQDGARRRPEARPDLQAGHAIDREQAAALHREIDRLPHVFRLAIWLCYFEGLSPDEAAARLRWPRGTLRSRLVRARDRLRRGLAQRGVVMSSAAMTATLTDPLPMPPAVSSCLVDATTRAAIAFATAATGEPLAGPAATLAREVLKGTMLARVTLAAMSVLLLAVGAAGAGGIVRALASNEEPAMNRPPTPGHRGSGSPVAGRGADDPARAPEEPEERMTVTGRVLDPDGKPAARVPLEIIAAPRSPQSDTAVDRPPFAVLSRGTSDHEGRFRIQTVGIESSAFADFHVLAGPMLGSGWAVGSVALHPDAGEQAAEIHLQPEQVLRGKLVDISGRPAAGVAVQVDTVYGNPARPGTRFDSPNMGRTDLLAVLPEGLQAWPGPVTTDDQGRFAMRGIGRGLTVWLSVHDPRFAVQRFDPVENSRDAGNELALALHPSKLIEGRVLTADTGKPIPDATIAVQAGFGVFGARFTTRFRADHEGRFRINPSAGDYFRVRAIPPTGMAYLPGEAKLAWTKAAVKMELDVKVPRGTVIHGTVTEQGSGRPVPDASIRFFAMRRPGGMVEGDGAAAMDGSFLFAVPPGTGYLLVLGPTLDYIPQAISGGTLHATGQRGGMRFWAHAVVAYEAKDGEDAREVNVALRRGRTLRGRLVGPGGESVPDAVVLTRQQIDPINMIWQGHGFLRARDGRFVLTGFDPDHAMPAYFLDAKHEWGAAVELSGKQEGEDLAIRLEPCGQAKARFVGPDGKPAAGLNIIPYVHLLMTPGATRGPYADQGEHPAADEAFLPNVDRRHDPRGLVTDADGRVTLPALIPGAPYRVTDWSTRGEPEKGLPLRKDFTVKPGETLDLGEILVEKP